MQSLQIHKGQSNKILELIVLVTISFCSVAMLLSAYFNHLAVSRLADQSLLTTAFALSNTVEQLLFERTPKERGQIREALSDRVVAYAMIVNREGKVVFHTNPSLEETTFTIGDRLLETISRGPKGRRITLQTGLPAYEFNYPLHQKEGTVDLLRLVLHTYPADNLLRGTWPIWWSLSVGIVVLWVSGLALIYLLRKQARIDLQRRREEQWTVLGRMSAVIAHEIRNAIGGIKGFVQWVDEKTGPEDQRKGALSLILKGTDRIENLIREMLLYARQETYKIESVDLRGVVMEALQEATHNWQGKVYAEIPKEITLLADREKLLRVIVNGIQNALQSMGDSGTLEIKQQVERRFVTLQIRDTGPGLSQEALNRAFEPFYTTKSSGTGLGLAYCKKVVEAMRGSITLKNNEDGPGALLLIRLRRADR